MRSFTTLLVVSAFARADEFKGSCTNGLDTIGVEQACYGRCHIYETGPAWYGACDYKVQEVDVTGPCGDSVSNACLSTFNAGWDGAKENCGNCYYVEMAYNDGTVNSVYLKTMDTNGSETKFEMNAPAWVKLCPYICAGSGGCAPNPEACSSDGGIIAQSPTYPGPISCAAQRGPVTFKRVDCNGSEPPAKVSTTTKAVQPGKTTTTKSVKPGKTTTTRTEKPGKTTTTRRVRTTTTTERESGGNGGNGGNGGSGSPISACKAALGHSTNSAWAEGCHQYCDFYGSSSPHCPNNGSASGLIACVKAAAPYCEDI